MKEIPVEKNQEFEVTVEDLSYQGRGVAKVDHYPLFIDDALPGEKILAHVMKASRNYGFAKVVKRYNDSPDRQLNTESAYLQTGIAPLQHLKYDAQLRFKQGQIKELLHKAHLDQITVAPTQGMAEPLHYRNKAQIPVRMVNDQLETGFFRQRSHQFVPMHDFLIQDPRIDQVLEVIQTVLREFEVPAYNERQHNGVIRHIVIRRGHYSGQVMVTLVTRSRKLPAGKQIAQQIMEHCSDVVSVYQNINSAKTNVIMGRDEKLLAGKAQIEDQLNGIKFAISPRSFFQVNSLQTEKIYQYVAQTAKLSGEETLIDAYCGIGTISLSLAKQAKQVYGVEIVADAIEDAKRNAALNGITNAEFKVAAAEEQFAKWAKAGLKPDIVVFDPPRKGLETKVLESTLQLMPQKIVYVSCNPATLVRDLKFLTENGYQVTGPIQPFDQFPQTNHVESITVLSRS
ncbi:23S rRNA (uracil(1939)-C(5))-methyltransferase RlmD [Liquorilactobacillus nagelii]|uniref:23S rRNA (uracil(1939)-C(5))-methyltransferase RlmD n=1 Tax=Liquorilactobacillus nagelii TaxID=82688 RepID=UPI0006EE9DFD|nr:23S rRNA (uracil(1939)-C(5))-methyltransferase RlmD [Liquorilactobacillus nagelii]KRL40398.1 tRNA (Uracil-5-) -methyltransferase [Liquorilactobacillus nagelii DSM 13675]QYH54710.1 23S rRNA (uracil(1939)-C(5))-methyltransferase RlmD [Liquorilactobacillus nagelii DSM 13675]